MQPGASQYSTDLLASTESQFNYRVVAANCLLFIEPNILHAPAVEQAVDHDCQSLQLGLPAGREAIVVEDRSSTILLQFLVDFPNEMPALLLISLHRLLIE